MTFAASDVCALRFVRVLDTNDASTATALAAEIIAAGAALDVLVNNAGVSTANHPIDPIVQNDVAELLAVLSTNIGGTVATTNALLPAMRAHGGGSRVVATLSSDLGSIHGAFTAQSAMVQAGGVSSYRISKAALNMACRVYAAELAIEGFKVVALSPGWVATDMGTKGGRLPPLTPKQSITGCLSVILRLTPAQSGTFLKYDGSALAW